MNLVILCPCRSAKRNRDAKKSLAPYPRIQEASRHGKGVSRERVNWMSEKKLMDESGDFEDPSPKMSGFEKKD